MAFGKRRGKNNAGRAKDRGVKGTAGKPLRAKKPGRDRFVSWALRKLGEDTTPGRIKKLAIERLTQMRTKRAAFALTRILLNEREQPYKRIRAAKGLFEIARRKNSPEIERTLKNVKSNSFDEGNLRLSNYIATCLRILKSEKLKKGL